MFSSVKIENFKSFSHLSLNNLSHVNLFFGKNNCGKTSLLESIFILSGMANPELPLKCNQFRDLPGIKSTALFFHNLNTTKDISISSISTVPLFERQVSIHSQTKSVKDISSQNPANTYKSDTLPAEIDELSFSGTVKTSSDITESVKTTLRIRELKKSEKIQVSLSTKYKETMYCAYFSPRMSLATIVPSILKIFSEKKEKLVLEALKNIDNRIKDFILVDNTIMVDIGLEKRLPINLLGDGVRKFFTLAVAMFDCQNGVLLVDEIDNGLHFSTMEKFWSILLHTSKMFNVQLFATTHNIDSIKGLNRVLLQAENTDYQSAVSAYKLLQHTDDTNTVLYYDFKSFSDLIESETEIR